MTFTTAVLVLLLLGALGLALAAGAAPAHLRLPALEAVYARYRRHLSGNNRLTVLLRGRRVILLFSPGCPPGRCLELARAMGARDARFLPLVHGVACRLPPQAVRRVSGRLAISEARAGGDARAMLVHVEDDVPVFASGFPFLDWLFRRRTLAAQQVPWGVERIEAPAAWAESTGEGVRVAVMDTGIDLRHPDLQDRLRPGYNALRPGSPPQDDNGHGTHVAGTVAATDDAIGVVGVAPRALLYPVKVLDRWGSGLLSDLVEGMRWCAENRMQVVNMSFGTTQDSRTLREAVRRLRDAGAVIVAAAGNEGPPGEGQRSSVTYPARYPEVIAVGAVDEQGRTARFSSRGPEVDVAAPGVGIPSTWPGRRYRSLSGTSMAAPHVSGVAALVLAAGGGLSPGEVRARITGTAEDLGLPAAEQGAGLVNARRAVAG